MQIQSAMRSSFVAQICNHFKDRRSPGPINFWEGQEGASHVADEEVALHPHCECWLFV